MRNIQKYQKDQLEKLRVKLRGMFSAGVMPQGITKKLKQAVQNCPLEKKVIPALIVLPSYRDQSQRDHAFSDSNGMLKKLGPLFAGNRELLTSSKDICIDLHSIPSSRCNSLFQSKLQTEERTPNKSLSIVACRLPKRNHQGTEEPTKAKAFSTQSSHRQKQEGENGKKRVLHSHL